MKKWFSFVKTLLLTQTWFSATECLMVDRCSCYTNIVVGWMPRMPFKWGWSWKQNCWRRRMKQQSVRDGVFTEKKKVREMKSSELALGE